MPSDARCCSHTCVAAVSEVPCATDVTVVLRCALWERRLAHGRLVHVLRVVRWWRHDSICPVRVEDPGCAGLLCLWYGPATWLRPIHLSTQLRIDHRSKPCHSHGCCCRCLLPSPPVSVTVPPTTQPCNTAACEEVTWSATGWGECVNPKTKAPPSLGVCGTGTQQRAVTCVRSLSGVIESDELCAGEHFFRHTIS